MELDEDFLGDGSLLETTTFHPISPYSVFYMCRCSEQMELEASPLVTIH